MVLLRLVAVVLFVIAGIEAEGWIGGATSGDLFALDSFGLACLAASFLPIPSPPG